MLVLADRHFYSYQAWRQAVATGAALLLRVSASLTLPVLAWLPDGSFRSVLINPTVRAGAASSCSPPRRPRRSWTRPRPCRFGCGCREPCHGV